jgi:hypothetical protein
VLHVPHHRQEPPVATNPLSAKPVPITRRPSKFASFSWKFVLNHQFLKKFAIRRLPKPAPPPNSPPTRIESRAKKKLDNSFGKVNITADGTNSAAY